MARPYPWYYAVNDRPVKIVELPDGGADALVFEAATGRFIPDRSYFGRVLETGIGKDIDQLTEAEFEALATALRPLLRAHLQHAALPDSCDRRGPPSPRG